MAVSLIEAWDNWPGGKLVLTGPPGAGKTHLTHVWAGMAGARIVAARDLAEADIPDLAGGPIAVEDVPQIAADADAMTALFHLHNLALANGHPLLMTGRGAPVHWGLGLPDLQSRVGGTPAAILELPDDSLLTAVLAKLFADRQLKPRVDVIPYLAMHMERSFDAARRMVAVLDAESLSAQKPLTRAMAAKVLGREAE